MESVAKKKVYRELKKHQKFFRKLMKGEERRLEIKLEKKMKKHMKKRFEMMSPDSLQAFDGESEAKVDADMEKMKKVWERYDTSKEPRDVRKASKEKERRMKRKMDCEMKDLKDIQMKYDHIAKMNLDSKPKKEVRVISERKKRIRQTASRQNRRKVRELMRQYKFEDALVAKINVIYEDSVLSPTSLTISFKGRNTDSTKGTTNIGNTDSSMSEKAASFNNDKIESSQSVG